jgi:ribonuclease R
VTSFGVFVTLNRMYADGLVHVTSLPRDYYHFDPVGHCLTGDRSGRVYRLGDPLRVCVTRVNIDDRKIDFDPVGDDAATAGAGRTGKSQAGQATGHQRSHSKHGAQKEQRSGRSARRRARKNG